MGIVKKVLKSDAARRTACWLAANYIRLVWVTGRWRVEGREHVDALYDTGKPFIVCFWHGRLLMMPYGWRRAKKFNMLISAHRDGELIANTVKRLGIDWIAGSTAKAGRTDKGGAQALRRILKALKAGEYVGMTPDGPRGPRMRVSDGIVTVARMSGAPILPLTFGARSGKVIGSWDRFLVALPFTEGLLMWGEPFYVPHDADAAGLETARVQLETRMNEMTAEVDRLTGREPVRPADESWERAA